MGLRLWGAALAAALVASAPDLAQAQAARAKVDLALYGRLPSVEDIALSPSGAQVAIITTDGEKRRITIHDLAAKKIRAGFNAGDAKIRGIQWADEDHLIVLSSRTSDISPMIMAPRAEYTVGSVLDIPNQKLKPLLGDVKQEALNIVVGSPEIRRKDGKTVVYVTGVVFVNSLGVLSMFEVTLGGRTRIVRSGDVDTEGFLIGQDGEIAAELLKSDAKDRYRLRVRGERNMLRSIDLPAEMADGLSVEGFTADGKQVLLNYRVDDANVWATVDSAGTLKTISDFTPEESLLLDHSGSRQYAARVRTGDELKYRFADPADQKAWTAILKAFPGQGVSLADLSDDHKRWLVLADSPTEGPAYYLVDLKTGDAQLLGSLYRDLTPDHIAPVRPVAYKAADGTPITGYLTLPRSAGEHPRNLPLVVLPHGGPASRDTPGFDWWAQALAAQGYAVLQPNFRGSAGFGYKFLEAGFGQWGRKMQTDLSDGVRDLAGQGIIDLKRVCIVGASYGGYAALAGATLDRGVYRCAAAIAGPADLKRMIITARNDNGVSAMRYWSRFMGVDGARDPDLAAISPALHAADVTIPVLLVHGKDDTVVTYSQSQAMADALKRAGKPYEFVTLAGEDHWLSRGATRLQMLQAVSDFLAKNNPVQ